MPEKIRGVQKRKQRQRKPESAVTGSPLSVTSLSPVLSTPQSKEKKEIVLRSRDGEGKIQHMQISQIIAQITIKIPLKNNEKSNHFPHLFLKF